MRRRDLILGTLAGIGMPWIPAGPAQARSAGIAPARWQTAMQHFPYWLFETSGRQALAGWERLKREGGGSPVVIGSVEDVTLLSERLETTKLVGIETHIGAQSGQSADDRVNEHNWPEIGTWPVEAPESPGLSVAMDMWTGEIREKVFLALVPTDDATAMPAYLRFGGRHAMPQTDNRIAALRSWQARYGAELVGASNDTLNIRVKSRPGSRKEALMLAREQYEFCPDIVDQGVGDLSSLAAMLMESDWWYFWWD
jgi:hypothetical protein